MHMPEEESGAPFNEGVGGTIAGQNMVDKDVGEASFNGVDASLNTTSNIPFISDQIASDNDLSDSEDSDYSSKGSNESTDESENSEFLEDDNYGSDVHE